MANNMEIKTRKPNPAEYVEIDGIRSVKGHQDYKFNKSECNLFIIKVSAMVTRI